MHRFVIEQVQQTPIARRQTEHVERKGRGHPDTICDGVAEAVSVALCEAYREACGRVLHHNVDKALLVAGESSPRLGGGRIDTPMRLILGDRATAVVNGRTIEIGDIAEAAARDWFRRHLRYVAPREHLVFQNEIHQGSPELVDIFAREILTANDTSAAVGYAPLTETEQLVLDAERYLNSAEHQQSFPDVGEDIKIMAFRRERRLSLTIAAAFVDAHVPDPGTYLERKQALAADLHGRLAGQLRDLDELEIAVNTLDDPARGEAGLYLTVLGTSAEGADCGQVGRGNRVNGVISLHRPMSTEAAAGKNPVSHVGKIYNVLAHQMAQRIHEDVQGVREVTVWLCSQIGRRLDDPWSVSVEVAPESGASAAEMSEAVRTVIVAELDALPGLIERLTRGELPVW
jgi:S-adenosylmethionine synthetase